MSTVHKASRRRARLRLGLVGPAGSGKTMGALVLAYVIAGDWNKVGLVDTERSSSELYVGERVPETSLIIGEFQCASLSAPYEIRKYMEAHADLIAAGCEVVILDSISHAWAGSGGLLDKQGRIAARGVNSYTAWRDVSPDHDALVEMMLSSPAHLIATMRSKVEYVLETNDKGKQVPRKIGMAPVQREGLDFEFTAVLDIDQVSHTAHASKDRTNLFGDTYFKITEDTGKRLTDWLGKGVEPPPPPRATVNQSDTARAIKDSIPALDEAPTRDRVADGADQLIALFANVPDLAAWNELAQAPEIAAKRKYLKDKRPELAERVEAAISAAYAMVAEPLPIDEALGMPAA